MATIKRVVEQKGKDKRVETRKGLYFLYEHGLLDSILYGNIQQQQQMLIHLRRLISPELLLKDPTYFKKLKPKMELIEKEYWKNKENLIDEMKVFHIPRIERIWDKRYRDNLLEDLMENWPKFTENTDWMFLKKTEYGKIC